MDTSQPPDEQLELLTRASTAMLKYMWQPERRELLAEVSEYAARLLNAENAAILLPSQNTHFRLVAAYPPTADSAKVREFKASTSAGDGMTSFLAAQKTPIRLNQVEIDLHPCNAKNAPEHLPSKKGASLLGIPILDHRGRGLALLKAENKLNDNQPDPAGFDVTDVYIAQILANQLKFVLETTQIAETLAALSKELHHAATEHQFYKSLLTRVTECLGCERADYISYDNATKKLIWKACVGPQDSHLVLPQPIPIESIVGKFLHSKQDCGLYEDVCQNSDYLQVWKGTKSEAIVRISDNKRTIGFINAESSVAGWLDNRTMDFLKIISQVCSPLIQTHTTETSLKELQSGRPTKNSLHHDVQNVFERIHRTIGFESQAVIGVSGADQNKFYTVLACRVRGEPSRNTVSISENEARFLETQFSSESYPGVMAVTPSQFSGTEIQSLGLYGTAVSYPLRKTTSASINSKSGFDGAYVLLCWTSTPGMLGEHNILSRLKAFADVISNKIEIVVGAEAENEIHRRYRETFNLLPQCVFQKDENGIFEAVNESLVRALGALSIEHVEGKTDFDFFDSETASKFREDDKRVMKEQRTKSWLETFKPKNSSEEDAKVILVTKTPIFGQQHSYWSSSSVRKVVGVVGIFWEVPETWWFFKCNGRGELLWANAPAIALFGTNQIGHSIFDRLDTINRRKFENILSASRNGAWGRLSQSDRLLAISIPDSIGTTFEKTRERIVELTEALYTPKGHESEQSYRLTGLDVTEREAERRALRQRNWEAALPGMLALGVAHSLKHLMGVIKAKEKTINKRMRRLHYLIPQEFDADLKHLFEIINIAKHPIDELMELRTARENLSHLRLLPRKPNLIRNLVTRAIESLGIEKTDVFDISGIDVDASVTVHGTLIGETFYSILQNCQMHAAAKKVIVSTIDSGHEFVVRVRDSGVGIREDKLTEIFEPFYTSKPNEGGNGIGLAYAKAVIENIHGGKIIASNAIGGGAQFDIYLPKKETLIQNENPQD